MKKNLLTLTFAFFVILNVFAQNSHTIYTTGPENCRFSSVASSSTNDQIAIVGGTINVNLMGSLKSNLLSVITDNDGNIITGKEFEFNTTTFGNCKGYPYKIIKDKSTNNYLITGYISPDRTVDKYLLFMILDPAGTPISATTLLFNPIGTPENSYGVSIIETLVSDEYIIVGNSDSKILIARLSTISPTLPIYGYRWGNVNRIDSVTDGINLFSNPNLSLIVGKSTDDLGNVDGFVHMFGTASGNIVSFNYFESTNNTTIARNYSFFRSINYSGNNNDYYLTGRIDTVSNLFNNFGSIISKFNFTDLGINLISIEIFSKYMFSTTPTHVRNRLFIEDAVKALEDGSNTLTVLATGYVRRDSIPFNRFEYSKIIYKVNSNTGMIYSRINYTDYDQNNTPSIRNRNLSTDFTLQNDKLYVVGLYRPLNVQNNFPNKPWKPDLIIMDTSGFLNYGNNDTIWDICNYTILGHVLSENTYSINTTLQNVFLETYNITESVSTTALDITDVLLCKDGYFYQNNEVDLKTSLRHSLDNQVKVYPTIINSSFKETLNIQGIYFNCDIEIYNSYGKLIYNQNNVMERFSIQLNPGMYYLRINTDNNISNVVKIISY